MRDEKISESADRSSSMHENAMLEKLQVLLLWLLVQQLRQHIYQPPEQWPIYYYVHLPTPSFCLSY